MPTRTPKYLPDVPTHVVQRRNNRDACFFAEKEFSVLKRSIAEG